MENKSVLVSIIWAACSILIHLKCYIEPVDNDPPLKLWSNRTVELTHSEYEQIIFPDKTAYNTLLLTPDLFIKFGFVNRQTKAYEVIHQVIFYHQLNCKQLTLCSVNKLYPQEPVRVAHG